jgi:uncharacterized protein YqgV (UPF0045/DUF77 family)
MTASAQVSIYPLRQKHIGPAVQTVRGALERHGLTAHVGPMSTLATGESDALFRALAEAFATAASSGEVVMTVTISNSCPVSS